MARPQKNTVEYFPFYCTEGKKMYYLEETYGNDGFATFIKLLRELAKTEYHYLNLSEKTTVMFLASKCKVSKETLLQIISDLVDLGKFNAMLWSENKVIWCQDFTDSIHDAYDKRNNKCITFEGLLHLLDGLGVRKLSKSNLKVDGNTQTILYNTKEKNTKEDFDVFWNLYDKKEQKEICIKLWNKLSENDKSTIIEILPSYVAWKSDKKFRPNPQTFLNQKRWLDEIPALAIKQKFVSHIPEHENDWHVKAK